MSEPSSIDEKTHPLLRGGLLIRAGQGGGASTAEHGFSDEPKTIIWKPLSCSKESPKRNEVKQP